MATKPLIINVDDTTKWIKYHPESNVAQKWGLREVIKEYNPNGKVSKLTCQFSTNPLFGYQRVSGLKEQVQTILKAIAQLADKESVARFLDVLSKCK